MALVLAPAAESVGVALLVLASSGPRGRLRREVLRSTWLDAWAAPQPSSSWSSGSGGAASGPRSAYFALCGASSEAHALLTPAVRWNNDAVGGGRGGAGPGGGMVEVNLACPNGAPGAGGRRRQTVPPPRALPVRSYLRMPAMP